MKDITIKDLTNFFVLSTIILFMFVLYASSLFNFLPSGVNRVFVVSIWKQLVLFAPFFIFLFILFLFLSKEKSFSYNKKFEGFQTGDFIFLLIPLVPVVQYVLSNQDTLDIYNSFLVFLYFAIFSGILCIIVPVLLSFFASKQVLIAASTSFVYVILNMASLSGSNNWHHQGSLRIQLAVLIIIFLILLSHKFIPKALFKIAVVVYFIINTAFVCFTTGTVEKAPQKTYRFPIETALNEKTMENRNDVFLLVYESYADNETMKHYGFNNGDQLAFLEANGFHVYHGIYTLGTATIASMSRVFNVHRKLEGRKFVAGGGPVYSIFRRQGYRTCGVFHNNYLVRGLPRDDIKFDFLYPTDSGGATVFIKAILKGEFSDDVSLEEKDLESYFRQKYRLLRGEPSTPLFMYSHRGVPGHRYTKALSSDDVSESIKAYLYNLKNANIEIRKEVNIAIENNPNAIIIIAGDHGPFLTKTGYGVHLNPEEYTADEIDRYDIQDRYGAFLAIKWPDKEYNRMFDISVLQDIFPAVFAYLYNDETIFEKTRIKNRTTVNKKIASGVYVKEGIVIGGMDDGEPLFKEKYHE